MGEPSRQTPAAQTTSQIEAEGKGDNPPKGNAWGNPNGEGNNTGATRRGQGNKAASQPRSKMWVYWITTTFAVK